MFDLSTHAQEIVLIIVAITVCILTTMKIVTPADFLVLATMVFVFYFSNTKDNSNPTPPK